MSLPNWIASSLSKEQYEPIRRRSTNACILAAAGSGKTRTLVHTLAADLASGIAASDIIAFTFTEKAAEELLARVHILAQQQLPDLSLEGLYIGTIHGWCLNYLSEQSQFYNFLPLDELHVDALISRLYDNLGLENAYGLPFPKGISSFLADVDVFFNEHLSFDELPEHIRPAIATFITTLFENRLMTFGGMIRYATEHLRSNPPVPNLRSLYVDEYQDVNPAQVALIKAMLPHYGRVIVVGDDLQCIYHWRGSDVTRILDFPGEFDDVSVHRMSTSYRSKPGIVALANRIADTISVRDNEKIMKAARPDTDHAVVHWLTARDELEQAALVADIVTRFGAENVPWQHIALLLRSVVRSGKLFIDTLEQAGVPVECPILSRGGRFIRDFLLPVLSWLRGEHPEPRNESEELEAENAADQLWTTVKSWISIPNGEDIFWDRLNIWLDKINQSHNDAYNVRQCLYALLDDCNISVGPDDTNLMVGIGIASQIIRSVEEVHRRRLEGQERRTPRSIISEVFYALTRNKDTFGESVPINSTARGVLLTTIHQSKGLEWPIVIIPALMQGRFPIRQRRHGTSYPDHIARRYGTSTEDEKRLFYVATTRAKDRLFLLDAASANERTRSIFLQELQQAKCIRASAMQDINPRVWRLSASELKGSNPPPIRIGLSDLLLYVECPYQFGLRRTVGIQPRVGDELGFGQGLHELIQRRFESSDPWSSDDLAMHAEDHINLPYMSRESEAESRRAIESRVNSLQKLGVFDTPVEPEMNVSVPFDDGIVHGIVDCVYPQSDGPVSIRDWKSNIHDRFMPRYARQLQFYVYALRIQGRTVSRADIVDVAATEKRRRLVMREVDIDEGTVSQLIDTLNRSMSGISRGCFGPTPSLTACSCCDMYQICANRFSIGGKEHEIGQ